MDRGNYQTKQKAIVLDIIQNSPDYSFTVDSLMQECTNRGEKVGKTTLYRILDGCITSLEVKKIYNDSFKRYEYQYIGNKKECMHHLHFKCRRCGKVIHLDCNETKGFVDHLESEHGILIDQWNSILYGICDECKKKGEIIC